MGVNRENRNHDYRRFAANRGECNIVIQQNIDKARCIIHQGSHIMIMYFYLSISIPAQ